MPKAHDWRDGVLDVLTEDEQVLKKEMHEYIVYKCYSCGKLLRRHTSDIRRPWEVLQKDGTWLHIMKAGGCYMVDTTLVEQ